MWLQRGGSRADGTGPQAPRDSRGRPVTRTRACLSQANAQPWYHFAAAGQDRLQKTGSAGTQEAAVGTEQGSSQFRLELQSKVHGGQGTGVERGLERGWEFGVFIDLNVK